MRAVMRFGVTRHFAANNVVDRIGHYVFVQGFRVVMNIAYGTYGGNTCMLCCFIDNNINIIFHMIIENFFNIIVNTITILIIIMSITINIIIIIIIVLYHYF